MYFSTNVSFSSLPVFLPTIIADMGYSAINAQGLSAPPSFAAFICALATTWIADRTQQRALVIVCTSIVGCAGYVILATVETVGVRYFATFLASAGVFSTIPNICGWTLSEQMTIAHWRYDLRLTVPDNQGNDTRRGTAVVLINLAGQCGPLLGTRIFPITEGPRYVKGMSICAAFMFFCALLALLQRFLLAWENRKLDRKYGQPSELKKYEGEDETVATENYGPNFRYVL